MTSIRTGSVTISGPSVAISSATRRSAALPVPRSYSTHAEVVLAGARSDAWEEDLRRLLLSFGFAPFDAVTDFDAAARIYRRCRRAGVTPGGMVDCMIAAVAYRRGAALLSWDVDIGRVARVVGVELDEASLRA